ncbi:hypothetical protein [Deefgea tanakiae]|nr:hypothetical protein [Deefgea tanakiae]
MLITTKSAAGAVTARSQWRRVLKGHKPRSDKAAADARCRF